MIKVICFIFFMSVYAYGFDLDDGSTIPDNHVADHYVGLISGQVSTPENIVDLNPNSFASLDITNHFVPQGMHSVVEVSWTNFTPVNAPGYDFIIAEAGSDEGPMLAVKVNDTWTGFLWVPGTNSAVDSDMYFKYDVSDMGITNGAVIQAARISNPLDYSQQTNDDFGHIMYPTHDADNNYVGYKLSHTDADPMYLVALQPPVLTGGVMFVR